jgi:pimeloyl-ACP methyl ester carboxylesterase
MPRILANGIQIHYQQAGVGPDVVLVHGVTGDLSGWYIRVMPFLAKGFRVTAYDLRGHGYSEMTANGYTSAHMAADLRGLLMSLGIERAHLVGHSFGANIALHCAMLFPERVASMFLIDPGIPGLLPLLDLEGWPELQAAQARLMEGDLMIPEDKWFDLEYMERVLRTPVPAGLRRKSGRLGRRLSQLRDATSALTDAQRVAGLTMDRIAQIRQPTMAMYGRSSPFLQIARHLEREMPNCQVVVVEGFSHFFALLKPELIVAAVRNFLCSLPKFQVNA